MPGRQERQRRGGTENLPAIAGFAAACDRAVQTLRPATARMANAARPPGSRPAGRLPGVHLYGQAAARLPNTSLPACGELDAERCSRGWNAPA
jgi:cysteine desulfurase